MGYPGRMKKLYDTPNHPWQKARIDEETGLVKKYGLRNKKSVWKHASELRKYRGNARALLGVLAAGNLPDDSHYIRDAQNIVQKLQTIGILKEDAKLEDILALKVDDLRECVLAPGVTATHRGAPWSTNALGLRDDATGPEKPPGTHRVVLLGDSIGVG